MSRIIKKQQILEILVSNLNTTQAQVVQSEIIADKLKMSVQETCELVKIMNEMGMLISDVEGLNSLITQKGVNCVAH